MREWVSEGMAQRGNGSERERLKEGTAQRERVREGTAQRQRPSEGTPECGNGSERERLSEGTAQRTWRSTAKCGNIVSEGTFSERLSA